MFVHVVAQNQCVNWHRLVQCPYLWSGNEIKSCCNNICQTNCALVTNCMEDKALSGVTMQESNLNVPPHSVPLWQICDLSLTFISTFPLYRESPDNLLPIKTNHRHPSETSINTSVVWQSGNVYFVFESAVKPHCMTLPMFWHCIQIQLFWSVQSKENS